MKECWRFGKERLVSAEEGLKYTEPVTGGSICSCDRLIQCAKLVLYIELILFVGWSSYTLLQAYDQEAVISFLNVAHVDRAVVDNVKTKDNGFSKVDVYPTEIIPTDDRLNAEIAFADLITENFETTTTNVAIKDSLESSKSDEDNDKIIEVPSLDTSEFKEDESTEDDNSEDKSVLEWGFPFLWYIHQESGPSTDESSKEARKSELDEALKRIFEDYEKEESNDISESRQTSSEKEDQKEESNFSSDDVPSSAEILNNLKKLYESIEAARRDLQLENIRDDEFLESTENASKDETSGEWKSPYSRWFMFNVESDNSYVDETTSNLNDMKVNPTDESTKETTYVKTSTVAANEEDNSSFMKRPWWEPVDETTDDFATFSEMENIDSDKKSVFFGPRTSIEDVPGPCTVEFLNGFKVVKCFSSSVDSEHSSDSSDSKKDGSVEEHTEYPENNWWASGNVGNEEKVLADKEWFNEKSNTYDSSAIDRIEKEAMETSTNSEDLSIFSPWWT